MPQHDHGTLFGRERRQRREHVARRRLEILAAPEGGLVGLDLATRAARPRPVDGAVRDDPVQPGGERPAPVEAIEGAHGGDEGLLRDVLRGRRVLHDQVGGPVSRGPVAAEELLHRLARACLRRADQRPLAQLGLTARRVTGRATRAAALDAWR